MTGNVPGAARDGERLLATLLHEARFVTPDGLAALVARIAKDSGASDAVVYLVDYDQRLLHPLAGDGVPPREVLEIDTTIAGRVFRTVEKLASDAPRRDRLWLPLMDGTTRMGVLELVADPVDQLNLDWYDTFAALVAELLVSKNQYGDALRVARRRRKMSLAAEMQWNNLPPLTFATRRAVISGSLEPSYDIAGDAFDYAANGDLLHVGIVDAMGHGFEAAVMAAVTVNAYRNCRHEALGLRQTYAAMDDLISQRFGPDRFVTAQLAELDTATGRLRWLNAGHPPPLWVRSGRVIGSLMAAPTLPIGFGGAAPEIGEQQLGPGDALLWFTDGVVEARAGGEPTGEFFGEDRLADLLERSLDADLPPPETVRRLVQAILGHQQAQLQDDATLLFMQWLGDDRQDPPM